jgi:hypothetical protein
MGVLLDYWIVGEMDDLTQKGNVKVRYLDIVMEDNLVAC